MVVLWYRPQRARGGGLGSLPGVDYGARGDETARGHPGWSVEVRIPNHAASESICVVVMG